MADRSSSRERKVRGTKIRTDRQAKGNRRAKKTAKRIGTRGNDGGGSRAENGDAPLTDPDDVEPDPFVATDEVAAIRRRITGWLAADQPVHLIGPTGSGKTALALSAAAERGRPVVRVDGDESVDTAALVGDYAGGERYEEDDRFVSGVHKHTEIVRQRWVDNPLSVAVREGATLVYNEFSRSPPAAHNVLLSVLEEGVLERPGKRGADRSIDVHPEFRVLVTSNTAEYAGVHDQQDALLDRFVGVGLEYYGSETEREIVSAHVGLSDEDVDRVVSSTRRLREEVDVVVGTRAAITAANGLAVFGGEDDGTEDEPLVDVFTDVLAPKVAGNGDLADLRETIERTL
ncbi:gas vesicle protein GvpN [Natrialbaceae archaeon AArc-T1-2]|uniref:gas vesicle protein GvpN n=1 Tax=Natrialbaceae archaeon AArc-T1-2 TaxID=3053904 RepID=UPI00255AE2E2|nr:gas vesicle protein GvpN [Natrialbaceae archaeon AArc-T1-2]WIV67594.1 gas vesicle protein GvpN [Natrialbaceae archaeon AArc-T1-2]